MGEPHFDKQANKGLKHLANATRFSLQGLGSAFRHESAFRQEILMLALVLPTGAWCAGSWGEFLGLLCACLLVLVVELLNSGIEAVVDRVGTEYNELAKQAKDYGSAAVMISLLMAGLVWFYILASYFLSTPA